MCKWNNTHWLLLAYTKIRPKAHLSTFFTLQNILIAEMWNASVSENNVMFKRTSYIYICKIVVIKYSSVWNNFRPLFLRLVPSMMTQHIENCEIKSVLKCTSFWHDQVWYYQVSWVKYRLIAFSLSFNPFYLRRERKYPAFCRHIWQE